MKILQHYDNELTAKLVIYLKNTGICRNNNITK